MDVLEAVNQASGCFETAVRDRQPGRVVVRGGDQWIVWVWAFECPCHLNLATAVQFDRGDAMSLADARLAKQIDGGECCRVYRHGQAGCLRYARATTDAEAP